MVINTEINGQNTTRIQNMFQVQLDSGTLEDKQSGKKIWLDMTACYNPRIQMLY